ncbi:MAG: hypothetical protein QMD77_00285 [Patescibacteria group bacterium]|nr:hypothetical protein [Patescibacteria group bacterium]
MKKTITFAVISTAIIFLGGCVKQNATDSVPQSQPEQTESTVSEKSCQADSDCACGRRIETKECFFGNAKYVDPLLRPCPDFCTGIDGRFRTKCVNGECRQVRSSPQP